MEPTDLNTISELLDQDSNTRDKIRDQVSDLDKKTRTMVGTLDKIHSTPRESIPSLLARVEPTLTSCSETTAALSEVVPKHQFWKWKDMWTNSLRSVVYCAALMQFLSEGTLMSLEQASIKLGFKEEWKDRVYLAVEDYLHALISMVNELSRYAVNVVTLGNFDEPLRISFFVKDLFAGFSMLNLKNDLLRRRFDSLKYDIKKIEEVVYDISLRGLSPPNPPAAS